MSESSLSIIIEDNEFCMELEMAGTIIYSHTFTPSEKKLHQCPHIILSFTHVWDPHNMVFPREQRTSEEEMSTLIHVSTMNSTEGAIKNEDIIEDMVFSIDRMNSKISSIETLELVKPSIDSGKSDVSIMHTFQSSERHLDVTAQDLGVH